MGEQLKQPLRMLRGWFWVMFYGYPAKKLYVIGVTGTSGKTTTSTLMYEVMKAAGIKVGLIATGGVKYIDREIDTGFHTTTPNADVVQKTLREMADAGVTHVVIETTSHALAQARVVGCNYKIGVLTNFAREHLDYHLTMERYAEAKAKLFEQVESAVLNGDDPKYEYFRSKSRGKVVEYTRSENKNLSVALTGEYNRYNVGAVEVVAGLLKIPTEVVNRVVKTFAGVPGRREEVSLGQKYRVVVDFAHKPNALEELLKQLRSELKPGKHLTVVFGCPSKRDVGKRPVMGEIAAKWAHKTIVTVDDPRDEDPDKIAKEIMAGITDDGYLKKNTWQINDRREAIFQAIKKAEPGDIVALAGKGNEHSLAVGGQELPWSDAAVAKEAIKAKMGKL